MPMIEVVITVAYSEEEGIHQGFQVKGVGEKIVEVHQGEDTLIGCEGIVEEADEGIDQKDTEEGPDARHSQAIRQYSPEPKNGVD